MSDLKLSVMQVGAIQTNCYFIMNTATKEAVVIDPGDEEGKILAYLKEQDLTLKAVLLTHGHFDHMMAAREVALATDTKVYCGAEEADLLSDPKLNVSRLFGRSYQMKADVTLEDQEVLELLGTKIQVLFTPGHTKGSVCYYLFHEHVLFAGDTIFYESVGRCDFPTGSEMKIRESVHQLLQVLPEDTAIYPGHGPATTAGHEKKNNPYMR